MFLFNKSIVSQSFWDNKVIGQQHPLTSWNYSLPNWIYVVLSRVKTLNGLFLVNKLKDELTKYQISDNLKREDERLDNLDEQFRVDINWEQKKKWFGFIN